MQQNMTTSDPATRSGGYFAPRRLGHVNLVVGDVDRSMDFYQSIVGIAPSYVQPLNRAGFLSNGNTHHDIGMVEGSGPLGRGRAPGLNHCAFELENEVDLVRGFERALAGGIEFARTQDHDIAHSVYGRDPDGNTYEVYADVIRDWRSARSGVVTKPKPDWRPGQTPPHAERNYDPAPRLARVDDAVFHPRRTTHAALVVSHFERTVDYYLQVVGLEVLIGGREAPWAVLSGTCGEHSLSLFRAAPGRMNGLHHIGMELWDEEDLEHSLARAKRNPRVSVVADVDHAVRRAVLVEDPDGILVQLYVDRNRSLADWAHLNPDVAVFLA
ncbi:MAG TPA: VOC family protein [Burkholderiaceae bacterium]|nr:VOC family protein [Burkholderiaceae bacterium]